MGANTRRPAAVTEPGKNRCDRAESGFKWSTMVDRNGVPIASALAGANRHDSILFEPTLESVADRVCCSTSRPCT